MLQGQNVIVTGLPRAGLTLACALIDQLPDAVCLNAPEWHLRVARKLGSAMPICKWLVGDFLWYRHEFLAENPVPDVRGADGLPFTDGMQPGKELQISKPGLTADFILGMKHHVLFTAILPQLVEFNHFKIIVVIRHPLDVICSWQTLSEPFISTGNPPGIANVWPEAYDIAVSDMPMIERMSQLYELFMARYYALRDSISIVKYEDIVSDPMTISRLFGIEVESDATSLISQPSAVRDMKEVDIIRTSLQKYATATKFFYPNI